MADKVTVLISGANQGIGFGAAKLLALYSPRYYVLIGSRDQAKGEKAVKEIEALAPKSAVSTIQLDITSGTSIKDAVSTVEKQYGRLDVLINNAGIVCFDSSLEKRLRDTFEVNCIAHALVTEAFAPLLAKSTLPGAYVIHVSSQLASLTLEADPTRPLMSPLVMAYSMSKAALNMMAVVHQKQYKDDRFKVFAYDPGYVITNITGDADERGAKGAHGADVSAEGIRSILEGKLDENVGKHVNYDGKVVPW